MRTNPKPPTILEMELKKLREENTELEGRASDLELVLLDEKENNSKRLDDIEMTVLALVEGAI